MRTAVYATAALLALTVLVPAVPAAEPGGPFPPFVPWIYQGRAAITTTGIDGALCTSVGTVIVYAWEGSWDGNFQLTADGDCPVVTLFHAIGNHWDGWLVDGPAFSFLAEIPGDATGTLKWNPGWNLDIHLEQPSKGLVIDAELVVVF